MSDRQRTQGDHHNHSTTQCENRDSCDKRICDKDRRRLLSALATGGSLSLAGCTGLFADPESESEPRQQYDIDYAEQRETLSVSESQTVLGAARDAGLDFPFDCNAGFCGACLSRADGNANEVVQMRMNDFDPLTADAVEAGYFLPCTSNPRADIEVDSSVTAGDLQEFGEVEEEDDDDTDVVTHTATYVVEDATIEVPEDQNLLEAGEEEGLELPYQCRVGRCGVCLSQAEGDASELVEMTANDYGPLDDEAISEGYFLTCTGQPRDDISFETGKQNEL